jgi:putative membrane protein
MTVIAALQPLIADTYWNHMDGGGWVFMGIGMLLFWGLVIFGVVWLVRTLTDHRSARGDRDGERSALEVLDLKLAEGAMSIEDYDERRQALTRGSNKH